MARLLPHTEKPRRASATASASPRIERSNLVGKFTPDDIEAKVRESRAYWNSPEGQREKAKQDRESRSRKPSPVKFPAIAKGTRPAMITGADQALIAKFI